MHAPYDAPHDWPASADVLRGMLASTDAWVGRLLGALKDKGMWERTVLLYSADNGGTQRGCNWPLRGGKHSNWEARRLCSNEYAPSASHPPFALIARALPRRQGGMRAAAFVSGGWLPPAARGKRSGVVLHVADWYATIATLGGADPTDNPPVPPLPVDPADPTKDIYGNASFPPVDGVDAWPVRRGPMPVVREPLLMIVRSCRCCRTRRRSATRRRRTRSCGCRRRCWCAAVTSWSSRSR